jgi:hypothetical protein
MKKLLFTELINLLINNLKMSVSYCSNRFERIFKEIGKPLMEEITKFKKTRLLKIPDLIAHLKNFIPKPKNKLIPVNLPKK